MMKFIPPRGIPEEEKSGQTYVTFAMCEQQQIYFIESFSI